jgi:beta-lactamase regulating signal transducer with metallopeptidase domain
MKWMLSWRMAHHRRRDNLTAALQMLVEVLFWFWPVVWLIGARMIAERERACDERVLAEGLPICWRQIAPMCRRD